MKKEIAIGFAYAAALAVAAEYHQASQVELGLKNNPPIVSTLAPEQLATLTPVLLVRIDPSPTSVARATIDQISRHTPVSQNGSGEERVPAGGAAGGMTVAQINALHGDPAIDIEHYIGLCMRQSGVPAHQTDQPFPQTVFSRLTSLFSPSIAEAAPASKTPTEVVTCLKNNQLLVDYVKKNKEVDLSTVQESNVIGESTYKDLPRFLADNKLMTLAEAKAMFGSTIPMTFKVGNDITSGPATMLESENEVNERRGKGEKMLFATGEKYVVMFITDNDGKKVVLVFRQDCANLLLPKAPKVAEATPSSTPTLSAIPSAVPVPSPAPTSPPSPEATAAKAQDTVTPTAVGTPRGESPTVVPATPTSAPTNEVPLPTLTPGKTATLVPTRTPGGSTPTAVGTPRGESPTVVPVTPTSAPTNEVPLPTTGPGITPTVVPQRTPGGSTPTAVGNRESPTSVPQPTAAPTSVPTVVRPNTPTPVNPNHNL